MTLRRFFLLALILAAAIGAWTFGAPVFEPAFNVLRGAQSWLTQLIGPYAGWALIAGGIAIAGAFFAFGLVERHRSRSQQEVNEALHALRQARKSLDAKVSQVVIDAGGDEDLADIVPDQHAVAAAQNGPETPAVVEQAKPATAPGQPKLTVAARAKTGSDKIGARLYFQPTIAINTGDVVSYDVYRSAENRKTKRHSYIQYLHAPGNQLRVRFELETFQHAARETRKIINQLQGDGPDAAPVYVDVPISRALLSDQDAMQSICDLYRAHRALKSCLRLSVDAKSLRHDAEDATTTFRALNKAGIPLSLNITPETLAAVDRNLLEWFDAAFISKTTVQDTLMRTRTNAAADTGGRKTKPNADVMSTVRLLRKAGCPVIARDVVCEADIVDMLDQGISVMAGGYFADPRPVRDDLMDMRAKEIRDGLNLAG